MSRIINYSSEIALEFLNYKYQLDRAKFLRLGYSFTDIAVDSIVPLFTNNKKTAELSVVKSMNDWKKPIDSEQSAQFFLNKIVVNRVEQEIIRIYKESDPLFAKIHDSISFIMEKDGYIKRTRFGTVYIHFSDSELHKKLITNVEFENLPGYLFTGKPRNILESISKYFAEEEDYAPAVPLNHLIKRLKNIYLSDIHQLSDNVNENYEEKIDIKMIINQSLNNTVAKLIKTYDKKLSVEEIEAFKKALKQIGADTVNGGITSDLYYYLSNQVPDLNKEQFYEKYHSILDYLCRSFKKEIALYLELG